VIGIYSNGVLYLDGEPSGRGAVRKEIRDRFEAAPETPWLIQVHPSATTAGPELGWLLGTLGRTGIIDYQIAREAWEPPSAEAVATAAAPSTPGAACAAAAPSWVRPISDARVGLQAGNTNALWDDNEEIPPFDLQFQVLRAAVGAHAELGDHVDTRILLNVIENHDTWTADFTTASGETGSVEVPATAEGWTPRVRDLWADLAFSERTHMRVGMQSGILGPQDSWSNSPTGYDTGGVASDSLVQIAGIEQDRMLGAKASSTWSDGAYTLEVMAANTEGSIGAEEDNPKALSARATIGLGEKVRAMVSGKTRLGGDDTQTAMDVTLEVRGERARVLAEYLGGSQGEDGAEARSFVGFQVGAAADLDVDADPIDKFSLVARHAFFDPRAQEQITVNTREYTAWSVTGVGLQEWWVVRDEASFATMLGYEFVVPMDEEAQIEHRGTLQWLWGF